MTNDPAGASSQTPPREISVGTDAAYAPASCAQRAAAAEHLRGAALLPHQRGADLLRRRDTVQPAGLDRWVRNFTYITYYDGWDGAHPRVFTPKRKPYIEFESGEEINNWLLVNPEVPAFIAARRRRRVATEDRPWCSSTRRPSGSATSSATT